MLRGIQRLKEASTKVVKSEKNELTRQIDSKNSLERI